MNVERNGCLYPSPSSFKTLTPKWYIYVPQNVFLQDLVVHSSGCLKSAKSEAKKRPKKADNSIYTCLILGVAIKIPFIYFLRFLKFN
jgi:hypothetical protein